VEIRERDLRHAARLAFERRHTSKNATNKVDVLAHSNLQPRRKIAPLVTDPLSKVTNLFRVCLLHAYTQSCRYRAT